MLTRRSFFAFGQFIGNIHKQNDNEDKGCRYLNTNVKIPKVAHFSNLLSNQTVIIRKIIPKIISAINTRNLNKSVGNVILGPTKALPNQAAEIFIERAENALNQARYLFFFTKTIVLLRGRIQ